MSKNTQGKWTVEERGTIDGLMWDIKEVNERGYFDTVCSTCSKANAQLIASAPDMLELLERMSLNSYTENDIESPEECIEMARCFLSYQNSAKELLSEIKGE